MKELQFKNETNDEKLIAEVIELCDALNAMEQLYRLSAFDYDTSTSVQIGKIVRKMEKLKSKLCGELRERGIYYITCDDKEYNFNE